MTAQREWFEKDYYKVLGVGEKATPKEITKAYRKRRVVAKAEWMPGRGENAGGFTPRSRGSWS